MGKVFSQWDSCLWNNRKPTPTSKATIDAFLVWSVSYQPRSKPFQLKLKSTSYWPFRLASTCVKILGYIWKPSSWTPVRRNGNTIHRFPCVARLWALWLGTSTVEKSVGGCTLAVTEWKELWATMDAEGCMHGTAVRLWYRLDRNDRCFRATKYTSWICTLRNIRGS